MINLSMQRIIAAVAFALLFGTILFALPAEAKTHHAKKHIVHHHHGAPVDGNARYSDIVIDAETGRILHAANADQIRHPASLTKMMTLYITFQALEAGRLRLDQYITVSSNAAEQSPTKLGLRPGQSIRVQDAILGLVTESANDAAVVLAEAMGGNEAAFGVLMTRQAKALGMKHTRFDNPSGLPDPDQVTTAHDMALLGYGLIKHYPRYYPYFSHDSFTYEGRVHHNHNHLMERYDGMDGIKTGYIRTSGFNLVASAVHGKTRLIGVVFGGHSPVSRDNQMAQLLDNGFAAAPARVAHTVKVSEVEAQGDGDDVVEDGAYITLPAKVAAVFAPAGDYNNRQAPETGKGNAPLRVAAVNVSPPQNTIVPPAVPLVASKIVSVGWGVQTGAYDDEAVARQSMASLIGALPNSLGKSEPTLQKSTPLKGMPLYRARFMRMDEQSARNACTAMIKAGQSCVVVAPEQSGR